MSGISAINSSLDSLAIGNKVKKDDTKTNELGQDAFLQLMISQLKNQDPLSPQDNGEFVSQLAQFSSVQTLDKLNNNFDSFASKFVSNQALQASSLVGRSVTVAAEKSQLDAGGVLTASASLPKGSSDFSVGIYNTAGSLVQSIQVPKVDGEQFKLRWNGQDAEVNDKLLTLPDRPLTPADPGIYTVKISALIDGKKTQLSTDMAANVNSVTLGKDGTLTLNLAGAGAFNMTDVKEINE